MGRAGDYAGMSNDKAGENPARRKPKVSWGRDIRPGLVGPKARPKGVVDGQRVNIPVLSEWRLTEGGTQEDTSSLVMVQVQAQRLICRQIRRSLRLKRDGEGCKKLNLSDSTLTRKAS